MYAYSDEYFIYILCYTMLWYAILFYSLNVSVYYT